MTAVILNPAAGGGRAGRRWRAMERALSGRIGPVEVHATAGPGDATALARRLGARGCDCVIAAGGDGTLHEVVNGLPPGVRLGVLPLGSGRDFVRTLGVRSVEHAIEVIAEGRVRAIDVVRARFLDSAGEPVERRFLNMASAGLGAVAARGAGSKWRRVPASVRYLAAALPALAAARGGRVRLTLDDGAPGEFGITTLALANGRYQGGGMLLAPAAVLDDGLLDVTLVEPVSLAEVAAHVRLLYSGAIYSHPKVRHWRAARVRVESAAATPVELDGEASGTLPLEAEALPGALLVLAPG